MNTNRIFYEAIHSVNYSDHNFDLKSAVLSKRESNSLRRKSIESALIYESSMINLDPCTYTTSPLLKKTNAITMLDI